MAGPRPEKVAVVEEVREHLGSSSAAILTEYRGLKVGDLAILRRQLRTVGADYKIFKNTLVRRATVGSDQAALDEYLKGPTAIVFVRDDVGPVAKVLRDFGRVHPQLIVKGGLLGTRLLDADGASALAELPSRDALLAQLAGAIAAPIRQFAGLLQALPRSLAYGLSALIEKRGGVGDAVEPADAAAEAAEPAEAADAAAEPATRGGDADAAAEPADAAAEAATAAEPADAAAEPADTVEPADTAVEPADAAEPADSAAEPATGGAAEATDTGGPADAPQATDEPAPGES